MPRARKLKLIWSAAARRDVIRLREFIDPHNPEAARNVADTLKKATRLLLGHPALGKPLDEREDRELFIPFGHRGYILRYRLEDKTLVIVRIWHGLEERS